MATIVVAHGAWSGGWAWRKMRAIWTAAGHEVWTPTLTGLAERSHLAGPTVDLDTHIRDIVGLLDCEDLQEVVLIGHSYGGMVATGVARRRPERLRRLVYLDALVPQPGASAFELVPARAAARMRAAAAAEGEGWRIPPDPLPPDTSAEDVLYARPRRLPQPIRTFEQALPMAAIPALPRVYLFCTRVGPDDTFRPFARRAAAEPGWTSRELDASHGPHTTCPEALAAALADLL
jgi:pimeloyl-ACP methyl ester carboxylesterase